MIYIDKISKKLQKSFIGVKKDDIVKLDIQKLFDEKRDLIEVTGLSEEEAGQLKGEFEFKVKNVNRIEPVITSYSIHYTKLYDMAGSGSRPLPNIPYCCLP